MTNPVMKEVPPLFTLCERYFRLPKGFGRYVAIDPGFANEEYKRLNKNEFYNRNLCCLSTHTINRIQTIKKYFFDIVLKNLPIDVVLKPTSSLKVKPFLHDQMIIMDIAKHICIFIKYRPQQDVIDYLNNFRALHNIKSPEQMEIVCAGIRKLVKKLPTLAEQEESKARLREAFHWHVYTSKNATVALKEPEKIRDVSEHGDKKSKKALDIIRDHGSKMLMDSLTIHVPQVLKLYNPTYRKGPNDLFDLVSLAVKLVTPLLLTIIIGQREGRTKLTPQDRKLLNKFHNDEKVYNITNVYNGNINLPQITNPSHDAHDPLIALTATVLNQLLKMFSFSTEIAYRSDLSLCNKRKLAPSFTHAVISVTCNETKQTVLVDPTYKQFLPGVKDLPEEDILVIKEQNIDAFKKRLFDSIPPELKHNFNLLWDTKEYQIIKYNSMANLIFSPDMQNEFLDLNQKKSSSIDPHENSITDEMKLFNYEKFELIKQLYERKGLTELLMTSNSRKKCWS